MPLRARVKVNLTAAASDLDETPNKAEAWKKATSTISVKKAIKAYYRDKLTRPSEGRRRGILHPSQLTKCRRYQQYDVLYSPRNPVKLPPMMQAVWDNGHTTESRLRNALIKGGEQLGWVFTPSVNLERADLMLAGETDGWVTTKDGTRWIVDFKTMNSTRFAQLSKPSTDYVVQFHAYMLMAEIPQSIVYYENKDNHKDEEFIVWWDDDLWADVHENVIKYVINATFRGELVPRDEDRCGGPDCPFHRVCYADLPFEEVDNRTESVKRKLRVIK